MELEAGSEEAVICNGLRKARFLGVYEVYMSANI